MALTRVQSNTATGSGVAPSVDIGSVPASGDLIVVAVAIPVTGRTVTISGFTLIPTNGHVIGGSVTQHDVFYKVATGVAGTDVITAAVSGSSVSWRITAVQYHDSDGGAWTLDKSAKASSSTNVSSASSGTTAATSVPAEVWVGVLSNKQSISQSAPTNGFALVAGAATVVPSYLYEKIVSAAAAANVTATLSTATKYAGTIGTFYPVRVSPPGPGNTVAPAVTGTPEVGSTLSSSTGTWSESPSSFTYQWQRDVFGSGSYSNIVGAAANTYVLVDADDGSHIRCVVIAANAFGSSAPANSNAVGPVAEPAPANTSQPAIVGPPTQYQALTVTVGSWSHMGGMSATYAFQWQTAPDDSTWADIPTATGQGFTLRTADVAQYIRCEVTATNSGGSTAVDTPSIGPVESIPIYRYVDLVPSYDIDNVVNVWTGQREGGSPYTWQNDSSIEDYFRRTKQINSLVSTDGELINQLQWKTALFSEPLNRIEAIAVMPLVHDIDLTPVSTGGYGAGGYGASMYGSGGAGTSSSALPPSMVPFMEELDAAFAREIGDRIVIHETPPGFDTEQEVEYMIQHVSGSFSNGSYKAARLEFQLWPTAILGFWIVGDGAKSLAGVTTRPSY